MCANCSSSLFVASSSCVLLSSKLSANRRSVSAATKNNIVTWITPTKDCNDNNDVLRTLLTKGPNPWVVCQMANPETIAAANVTSACPKQKTTINKNGIIRYDWPLNTPAANH